MGIFIDLTGQKFGKWTVLRYEGDKYPTKFVCRCECGTEQKVRSGDLRNGHSKGCKLCSRIKHNMTNTRIYKIWGDMRRRCYNKNLKCYPNYGGRGIKVCDEWENDFENFYNWAMENGYTDELTIDRIDVNGNYEPDNCRWATMREQGDNKRNTLKFFINNKYYTFNDLQKETGLVNGCLKSYYYRCGEEKFLQRMKGILNNVEAINEQIQQHAN